MATRSSKTFGQATSIGNLYDLLIDFMVNAAGWTLHTDIALRDKVYSTNGESGTQPTTYIRLTENLYPENNYMLLNGKVNNIVVRGYVDYTNNIFPFGLIGPEWQGYKNNSTTRQAINLSNLPSITYATHITPISDHGGVGGVASWNYHNSRKAQTLPDRLYQVCRLSQFSLSTLDEIRNLATDVIPSGLGTYGAHQASTEIVIDPTTGEKYIYGFTSTTTAGLKFRRVRVRDNVAEALADPPWASNPDDSSTTCFDGVDKIYAVRGGASTDFAVYTISTNTWTSLAALPLATASNSELPPMFYKPAAVTGLTGDRIYYWINRGNASSFYYYDVSTNTWIQAAAVPFTETTSYRGEVISPTANEIVATGGLNSAAFKAAVYNIQTDTWTVTGMPLLDYQGLDNNLSRIFHFYPGTLIGPSNKLFDWWFSGNKDYISVVFREQFTDGTSRFRFLHFGYYNPRYSTTRYALANPASAGSGVTIDVTSDPTVELTPGSSWLIVDPTTQANEQIEVLSTTASTVTVRSLSNNYTTSAYITQDPHPFVITNGDYAATPFALDGHKPNGVMHKWVIYAPYDSIVEYIGLTTSNSIPLKEAMIFNTESHFSKTDDIVGSLKGVYMVPNTGGFPGAGDEIKVKGSNSVLLVYPETFDASRENRYYGILLA